MMRSMIDLRFLGDVAQELDGSDPEHFDVGGDTLGERFLLDAGEAIAAAVASPAANQFGARTWAQAWLEMHHIDPTRGEGDIGEWLDLWDGDR